MGNTVTPNLGLIKPDINESIKAALPTFQGWAAQNGSNCDTIDALFRATNVTSYTLGFNSASGGFTLGTGGFTEGKYLRLWPRLVIAYFRVFCGTTGFAAGTADYYKFNLPTGIATEMTAFSDEGPPLGKAIFQDSSAIATSSAYEVQYYAAANACILKSSASGTVTTASPVAMSQSDRLSGYLIYPTSDA